jgi:hypothetical protein
MTFMSLAQIKFSHYLARHPVDICDLSHIEEYYRLLYEDTAVKDGKAIRDAVLNLDFTEVDRQYKLIDKHTVQIIVPFDKKLFEDIRSEASNLGMSAC